MKMHDSARSATRHLKVRVYPAKEPGISIERGPFPTRGSARHAMDGLAALGAGAGSRSGESSSGIDGANDVV